MSDSTFDEETITVIRHLQHELEILIDSVHTAEALKAAVDDYLENLIKCGPRCIYTKDQRLSATRKDPPPRVPFKKCPHPHHSKLRRFSSPTNQETILYGIKIPPGSDVIELPEIRPHIRDFFFVEGNVKHFVSIDNRPTSSNSSTDRLIFHSTCPQKVSSRYITPTTAEAVGLDKANSILSPVDENANNLKFRFDDTVTEDLDCQGGKDPCEEVQSLCAESKHGADFSVNKSATGRLAEESVLKYEKSLRDKYEAKDGSEIGKACDRIREIAEFERKLNEKYSTKHTCSKMDVLSEDPDLLLRCDRELSDTSMNEVNERVRDLIGDVEQPSNGIAEDASSLNMGDDTFIDFMLRVDPLSPRK